MLTTQYRSRRQWNLVPSEGTAIVVWWKITDGKRSEELKTAKVFVEIFTKEDKLSPADQEKSFIASLKGYGAVISRKEYTIQDLNKKI